MDVDSVEAYSLQWPPARKRTTNRTRANFHRRVETGTGWKRKTSLTIADSRNRVEHEISILGGKRTVISSNLQLRNDGLPRSNQSEPADPGVAVYFYLNGQSRCVSCDKWDRAADNLAAIAKFIEAMRGQLRWGVGDVNAMFSGFKALPDAMVTPAPMSPEEAMQFVADGIMSYRPSDLRVKANFESAYKQKAMQYHPDRNNGVTRSEWLKLQNAAEVIRKEFRW